MKRMYVVFTAQRRLCTYMHVDSYQEIQVLSHVHEKPPNHSSKVNNMGGLMLLKDFSRLLQAPEDRIR